MASNNIIEEIRFSLPVKVSGNQLQFNEYAWQKLIKLYSSQYNNDSLIILSVVGQPKSGKTSLLNDIISKLRNDSHPSTHHLHLTSEGEIQGNNYEKFGEGILACLTRNESNRKVFLLLDILSKGPSIETYNKLVDFCLFVSSVVIFLDSWNQDTSWTWCPERSKLFGSERSPIKYLSELHFLINITDGPYSIYVTGCQCDDYRLSPLQFNIYTFLKNFTPYVTSSYIPTTDIELTSLKSVKSEALWQILFKCADNAGTAEQMEARFAKCLEFVNGQSSTTVYDNTDEVVDVEMKSEIDASKAYTTNFSENDSNATISYGQTDFDRTELLQICYDCVNSFIDDKGLPEFRWEILNQTISQSCKDNCRLRTEVEKITNMWLTALQSYNENFTKRLQREICVDDDNFEKLHQYILADVKKDERKNDNSNDIFEKLITRQKQFFFEYNKCFYEKENQISEDAYNFAATSFMSLLNEILSISTFSEQEFHIVYDRMSNKTLKLFLHALELPHTTPWLRQCERLKKELSSLRENYTSQNKNQLKKVDETRKEAFETGTQFYKDQMRKYLKETKMSSQKLESVSQTCADVAKREFRQSIGKNISGNISVLWENQMNTAINAAKSIFFDINEKLTMPSMPSIELKPGVGMYIDHRSVIICVDKHFDHFDQDIAVIGKDIFFGKEALNKVPQGEKCCTVFGLLTDLDKNIQWHVDIDGQSYNVASEAILTLFFLEIRMEIERKITQRISSCVVAITGLLTSKAKQILKTSLTLAGFQSNTLIPSTTAMAISCSQTCPQNRKPITNLFIYTSHDLFEVALADVSNFCVKILKIFGNYKKADNSKKTIKNILDHHLRNHHCQNIVFWCVDESDLNTTLIKNLKDMYPGISTTFFRTNQGTNDVIKVTALMDSVHNNSSVFHQVYQYNFMHPYKICVEKKISFKQWKLLQILSDIPKHNMLKYDNQQSQKFRFVEKAEAPADRWDVVDTYKLTSSTGINVSLLQGALSIQLDAQAQWKTSCSLSMISIGRKYLLDYMKTRIEERVDRFARKYPALEQLSSSSVATHVSIPSLTSIDYASQKLLDDVKKRLESLIEKTKYELKNSKLTPAAHRHHIESKISKCEALIKSSTMKVKQLQIEETLLKTAATKIIK